MVPAPRLRPSLALTALALIAACQDAPTGPSPDDAAGRKPAAPEPSGQLFYAGVFLGDALTKPELVEDGIRDFARRTGKSPSLVKSFHTLDCDFSESGWCGALVRRIASTGAANYLAMDLRWQGAPEGGTLDAILAGGADARFAEVARALAQLGTPVLLEPGWEMNGDWGYAWQGALNGGDATAPVRYAAAWRRMVDVFRREGATNVQWVFNPNAGNPLTHRATGPAHWNWYGHYYPGDAYVDYVGAHGFNAPRVWGGSWQDFGTMFDGESGDRMLSDLATRYPGKPILLGEMASDEGAPDQKAAWIADAYARMRANPRVVGAIWFDMAKEADWRVDSSPSALKAYREAMAHASVQTAYRAPPPAAARLASRD